MAIHICRDFTCDSPQPSSLLYLTSIFFFGVLGFTQVGHTNLNLSSSYQVTAGVSASINMGVGSELAVHIPTTFHTVTSADVDRILALKSSANPRHNSGLFRITSVNTGSNYLFINFRSSENPPAETATLNFKLFLSESSFSVTSANNSAAVTNYHGNGSSTTSRIILQSPNSSSWQVRLAYEAPDDRNNLMSLATIAPGFGGDASGDFPSGSYDPNNIVEHLHTPLWRNASAADYRGSVTNFHMSIQSSPTEDTTSRIRFYAWGDDDKGTSVFVVRNVSSSYADGWYAAGLADDDGYTLPPRTSQRLFSFGPPVTNSTKGIIWSAGDVDGAQYYCGVSFGLNLRPVSCVPTLYSYLGGQTTTSGIKDESVASDNALLGATELQAVELIAGTLDNNYKWQSFVSSRVFEFDPRKMGRFPIARLGRSNFTQWTTTTDVSSSYYHTANGVFFPWQGPAVIA